MKYFYGLMAIVAYALTIVSIFAGYLATVSLLTLIVALGFEILYEILSSRESGHSLIMTEESAAYLLNGLKEFEGGKESAEDGIRNRLEVHVLCPKCNTYITVKGNVTNFTECFVCGEEFGTIENLVRNSKEGLE